MLIFCSEDLIARPPALLLSLELCSGQTLLGLRRGWSYLERLSDHTGSPSMERSLGGVSTRSFESATYCGSPVSRSQDGETQGQESSMGSPRVRDPTWGALVSGVQHGEHHGQD